MAINTLADVQTFFTRLINDYGLWPADDECLSRLPADKAADVAELSVLKQEAFAVCEAHGASVWDFLPNLDEE